jgi:hypothetical protein
MELPNKTTAAALRTLDDACNHCRYDHMATPKIAKTIIGLKHHDPDALPLLRAFWRALMLPPGEHRRQVAQALLLEIRQRFEGLE